MQAPKMYNEAQGADAVAAAAQIAPQGHTATSATSTLAKLLSWQLNGQIEQVRLLPEGVGIALST